MIEFLLKRSGILFVISAPSGGGKSTILRALLKADNSLGYSVSVTTRERREGETEGGDYYFRTVEEFEMLVREDAFIEHARVHGNYYGTLKEEVDRRLRAGEDVLLDIDVQGSLALKKQRRDMVSIFVLPPSIATLEKRLRARGKDSDEVIRVRLENARGEIRYARHYDYVLVNQQLDDTIEMIQKIISAERCRARRVDIKDPFGLIEFLPIED